LSAAKLLSALPLETQLAWPKRLSADVIVLVDWFGRRDDAASPVAVLHDILTKVTSR